MIKVCIVGASGRLGSIIVDSIRNDKDFSLTSLIVKRNSKLIGQDNQGIIYTSKVENPDDIDVIIDFSTPSSTLYHIQNAVRFKKPYVIGTTGFSDDEIRVINSASKEIPVMLSYNYSYGIAFIKKAIADAVKALGDNFDVEIMDTHHRNKIDSPSGTAISLFNAIHKANPQYYPVKEERFNGEKRNKYEVGIMSHRGGNIFGEHEVRFISDNEEIYIGHKAFDRNIFALGAIKAAKWLIDKPGGMYEFEEVL